MREQKVGVAQQAGRDLRYFYRERDDLRRRFQKQRDQGLITEKTHTHILKELDRDYANVFRGIAELIRASEQCGYRDSFST